MGKKGDLSNFERGMVVGARPGAMKAWLHPALSQRFRLVVVV